MFDWFKRKPAVPVAPTVPAAPLEFDDDALRMTVLQNLQPYPNPSALFPKTEAELDSIQEWIDWHRRWAATVAHPQIRDAYIRWMDYFQRGVDENREENRTHNRQNEFNDWSRRNEEEWQRVHALAPRIPAPPKSGKP